MSQRLQFSLRSFLIVVTGLAASLAAMVQIPHVFVFALSCAGVVFASFVAFRAVRTARQRTISLCASIAAWAVFYALSLGPFIAFSELEKKCIGQYYVGRLADAYRLAMLLNSQRTFRWYLSRWIPLDAVGLHALYPPEISPALVGTWQGEVGNTLDLRADGTAQARVSTPSKMLYAEWTSDPTGFRIYQYGSKQSAFAWFGRVKMNYAPTDSYPLVEASTEQFKISDKTGKTYSFTRTRDNSLESAP